MPTVRKINLIAVLSFVFCLLLDNAIGFRAFARPVYVLSGFDSLIVAHFVPNHSMLWRLIHDFAGSRNIEDAAFAIFFLLHDLAWLVFYTALLGMFLRLASAVGRGMIGRHAAH